MIDDVVYDHSFAPAPEGWTVYIFKNSNNHSEAVPEARPLAGWVTRAHFGKADRYRTVEPAFYSEAGGLTTIEDVNSTFTKNGRLALLRGPGQAEPGIEDAQHLWRVLREAERRFATEEPA